MGVRERRARRRNTRAWIGSGLVHGVAVLLAWLTTVVEPRPMEFVTYEIQMVQAPEEEFVVETPDPAPPAETERKPEPEPIVEEPPPEREPEPERKEPDPEPEPDPPPRQPDPPPRRPDPEPPPQRTEESMEATMEGLRKDYPLYYAEIRDQIRRCFRWTGGGSWRATVDFYIDADGSVPGRDIDISRPSGNLDFDLRAVEAVECAGGRLGPLPDDLPFERLPVRFNFTPIGSGTDDRAR